MLSVVTFSGLAPIIQKVLYAFESVCNVSTLQVITTYTVTVKYSNILKGVKSFYLQCFDEK